VRSASGKEDRPPGPVPRPTELAHCALLHLFTAVPVNHVCLVAAIIERYVDYGLRPCFSRPGSRNACDRGPVVPGAERGTGVRFTSWKARIRIRFPDRHQLVARYQVQPPPHIRSFGRPARSLAPGPDIAGWVSEAAASRICVRPSSCQQPVGCGRSYPWMRPREMVPASCGCTLAAKPVQRNIAARRPQIRERAHRAGLHQGHQARSWE